MKISGTAIAVISMTAARTMNLFLQQNDKTRRVLETSIDKA